MKDVQHGAHLQPITPSEAVSRYFDGRTDLADSSADAQMYRLQRFVDWCEEEAIDDMRDLTGRKLNRFKGMRANEVNNVSLNNQVWTLRRFLRYCEQIEAVPVGLSEKIEPPQLSEDEDVNEEMLEEEQANEILNHLSKYQYATRKHVTFILLWTTAIRMGTLRAIDIADFHPDEKYIEIVHRPDTGTPLKNKKRGQRHINIDENVVQIVNDYLNTNHPKVEDEYGRLPLISTREGRAHNSTIRNDIYQLSRPCEYLNDCPVGKHIRQCEWSRNANASKCPASVSPHAIRKGSITDHLNRGWPLEAVSERANVSQDVLKKHYDKGTPSEKRKRRMKYIDNL